MDRHRLAELLDGPGYASTACRHALLDGARFLVGEGSAPANRMVPAYERREALAVEKGTATLGFAEALHALRECGSRELRLGKVALADPPYLFTVFLAEEPEAVVACLGVNGSGAEGSGVEGSGAEGSGVEGSGVEGSRV